jgi:hypothetical protein
LLQLTHTLHDYYIIQKIQEPARFRGIEREGGPKHLKPGKYLSTFASLAFERPMRQKQINIYQVLKVLGLSQTPKLLKPRKYLSTFASLASHGEANEAKVHKYLPGFKYLPGVEGI